MQTLKFSFLTNADHLLGSNGWAPGQTGFLSFFHTPETPVPSIPVVSIGANHFGIYSVFPSKSPVPFTPRLPLLSPSGSDTTSGWLLWRATLPLTYSPSRNNSSVHLNLPICSLPRKQLKWMEMQTIPHILSSQVRYPFHFRGMPRDRKLTIEAGCPDVGWSAGGMAWDCFLGWNRWIRRPV